MRRLDSMYALLNMKTVIIGLAVLFSIQLSLDFQVLSGDERNEFFVGFDLVHYDDHAYFIYRIDSGMSAEKKGIEVGDFLLSVNGVQCSGLSPEEIISLLQRKGDNVSLVLVNRDLIVRKIRIVKDSQKPLNVYFFDIDSFMRQYETSFDDNKELH